jgi:hypothetical protein
MKAPTTTAPVTVTDQTLIALALGIPVDMYSRERPVLAAAVLLLAVVARVQHRRTQLPETDWRGRFAA